MELVAAVTRASGAIYAKRTLGRLAANGFQPEALSISSFRER